MGYTLLTIVVIVISEEVLTQAFGSAGLVVWLAGFVGGSLFLLVRWHAKNTAYRCPVCDRQFEISVFTDFVSPHLPGKKYLKCPQCGKRSWATILMKKNQQNGSQLNLPNKRSL